MEELHSTEVLDREILEDARKKAFKILKGADDAAGTAVAAWNKKAAREIANLRKSYEVRLKKAREEIMAVLPLDERRLRSQRAETLLQGSLKTFLDGLGRQGHLELLERELRSRLEACPEFVLPRTTVYCRGITAEEIKACLRGIFSGEKAAFVDDLRILDSDPAFNEEDAYPGVLLDSARVRIRASVKEAAKTILRENRAEMAAALLGEGALND
jgi:hypothetical protein